MKLLGKEISMRELVLVGITLAVGIVFGIQWLVKNYGGMGGGESPALVFETLQSSANTLESRIRSLENLKETLGVGKFRLPSTEEASKVLSYIDRTARESGLSFNSLTASAPRKGRNFQTIGYRFTVTSKLYELVKFIDLIQSGEFLIVVENWDMKTGEKPGQVVTNLALKAYFDAANARGGA